MNNRVVKMYKDLGSSYANYLPHQIGTVDWILHSLLREENPLSSLLIFHKPGTGKTIIGILTAIILSSRGKKVTICAPNSGLLSIWKSTFLTVLTHSNNKLLPVKFITKNRLATTLSGVINGSEVIDYNDHFFIIDEGHEILDTNLSDNLLTLRGNNNMKIILMTGTPIVNTPKTLITLLDILLNKNYQHAISLGNLVYDIQLKPEYIKEIKDNLTGHVSYFDSNTIVVAKSKDIDLELLMMKPQITAYNSAKSIVDNEMFQQALNNVSLFSIQGIYTLDSLRNLNNGDVVDKLTYNSGLFYGDSISNLNKLKDRSIKLYTFINSLIQGECEGKVFAYINNPGYGIVVIRSIMSALKIEEYDSNIFYDNPICHCGKSKLSHKLVSREIITYISKTYHNQDLCCEDGGIYSPMKYVILSSNNITDPNYLIDRYNHSTNDEGRNIKILIGSDIISVGYTLTEVKSVHFLTMPVNKNEEEQIIKRAIRYRAHKNPKKVTVQIYRYISTLPKSESNKSYDEKKKKYITEKFSNTNLVSSVLIDSVNYMDLMPHSFLHKLLTFELIRYKFIESHDTMEVIYNSLKSKFKEIGITPDETILKKSLAIYISKSTYYHLTNKSYEPLVLPYQKFAVVTKLESIMSSYTINGFIIIQKRNLYYYTTNNKQSRNLNTLTISDLLEIYKLCCIKVYGFEKKLEQQTKNYIISSIIQIIIGTEYLLVIE